MVLPVRELNGPPRPHDVVITDLEALDQWTIIGSRIQFTIGMPHRDGCAGHERIKLITTNCNFCGQNIAYEHKITLQSCNSIK